MKKIIIGDLMERTLIITDANIPTIEENSSIYTARSFHGGTYTDTIKFTDDIGKNKEVFKLAFERVDEYLNKGQDVFFDATNVNKSQRKNFTDKYIGTDVEVIYVILPADIDLSWKRIRADIREKKNRSDVPYFALVRQKEQYDNSLEIGFNDENVSLLCYYIKNK